MSQGKAVCTCKTCGAEFIKTKTCRNTREAASWEDWAKGVFDTCPVCYKKEIDEEKARQPLTLIVRMNPYRLDGPVVFAFDGNTKPVKDQIKELGFYWEEDTSGFLGILKKPVFYWQRYVKVEDADGMIAEYKRIFPELEVKNEITEIDLRAYHENCRQHELKLKEQQKREDAMQKEISMIEKPLRPSCLPDGKWNGKIYGSARSGYSVYVTGEKIELTKAEKDEIEAFETKIQEYEETVAEIKKRYK